MKRGLLALVLVTTLGGVASAHMVAAPAPKTAAPTAFTTPRTEAPTAATSSAPARPRQEASAVTVSPPTGPRELEVRQAPIPLKVSTKPHFVPPPADVVAPIAKPAPDRAPPRAEEPKARVESSAKAAIEADGYKGVRGLTRNPDGTWRGRALRGNTEIAVTVDAQGRVSAD